MKKYKKSSFSFVITTDEQANTVGRYLETQFPTGQITPEEVVTVAQSEDSPIHKFFEWNNDKAAHEYRLGQARQLIKSIVIVDTASGKDLPAYNSVVIEKGSGRSYVTAETCLNQNHLWRQVILSALREAKHWADRYERYSELKPIADVINKTKQEIEYANDNGNSKSTNTETENTEGRSSRKGNRNSKDRAANSQHYY